MIDELDYQTLQPARTIAFDVFDYATAMLEGRDPRQYEQVSYTQGDEVKWNPLSVGSLVYVVGEMTGTQTYGACGLMTGRSNSTRSPAPSAAAPRSTAGSPAR